MASSGLTTAPSLSPIRQGMDSIVYLLDGPWTNWGRGQLAIPPAALLVWAPYLRSGNPQPTWEQYVEPIFSQYMKLYPGMKQILELTDQAQVMQNLQPLLTVFFLPFDHPHYMPVTRDLSPQKIDVIKTWIRNQLSHGGSPRAQSPRAHALPSGLFGDQLHPARGGLPPLRVELEDVGSQRSNAPLLSVGDGRRELGPEVVHPLQRSDQRLS